MTTDTGWEGDMDKITIEEYQAFTPTTFVVKAPAKTNYLEYGLMSEVGEFMGHVAKYYRADFSHAELERRIRKELGDIMYFIAQLCNEYGWDLRDILQENKDKLEKRMEENKIKGDGDDR